MTALSPGCHRAIKLSAVARTPAPCRNAFIENDARTDAGAPILFCYLPDLPRLFRFFSALELLQMKGAILCFDFQADALQALCGDKVELQTIDFAEFERRFLTSP